MAEICGILMFILYNILKLTTLCCYQILRKFGYNLSTYHTTLFCSVLAADMAERKLSVEQEEAKRIAEMGKPTLGDHAKLEVIIEESYDFKVRNFSLWNFKGNSECAGLLNQLTAPISKNVCESISKKGEWWKVSWFSILLQNQLQVNLFTC